MTNSSDSSLHCTLQNLDYKQAILYDGVRFIVESIKVAYDRLLINLQNIATSEGHREARIIAAVLLDAWFIIDSTNRLRKFIDYLPRTISIPKKDLPERIIFLRSTQIVEEFRNRFQHLNDHLRTLAQTCDPVLGTLSWFTPNDEPGPEIKTGSTHLVISGSAPPQPKQHELFTLSAQRIHYPVGLITLRFGDLSLSLNDTMESIAKVDTALRREMTKRFRLGDVELPYMYIRLDLEFR